VAGVVVVETAEAMGGCAKKESPLGLAPFPCSAGYRSATVTCDS
jgi:hypothetical protein